MDDRDAVVQGAPQRMHQDAGSNVGPKVWPYVLFVQNCCRSAIVQNGDGDQQIRPPQLEAYFKVLQITRHLDSISSWSSSPCD